MGPVVPPENIPKDYLAPYRYGGPRSKRAMPIKNADEVMKPPKNLVRLSHLGNCVI